ncbi:hypothetical protein GUITHDRAFT_149872 [Guillardia theta CCMP2712]|uniref:EamA domain-containing protein n=1 Tax=Guillardia theta (strain CCMP2712) TaxID=905079 RepID=L1K2N7_GUITC|nr:hypothetical protein GUITHDRAFT_149872 [Guillardia theta CCMP2712]EKX54827.1 hypothetical protein GUITHDRAFT_149872 [Guillardia theta CCMP2712]|eukprot:XP_005841807.1 hypothetical protein GUITHDRAFT_149872 [Guillardia theta CCMP2712]
MPGVAGLDGISTARLVILGVAALYGTNFGSVKILESSLDPSAAAFVRFGIASLAMLPLLKNLRVETIKPGLEIGMFAFLGYFAQGIGLQTCHASTMAFLCSLAVVVCPLLDVLEGSRLGAKAWTSVGLAIAGTAVLELAGADMPGTGDLWALIQPLAFGAGFWRCERVMRELPDQAAPLTAMQILTVGMMSMMWMVSDTVMHPGSAGHVMQEILHSFHDGHLLLALLWTGIATTAITVGLETWALGKLTSAETTVLFATEPLWGTAFAHAVLGEQVGSNAYLGGTLILAACLFRVVDGNKLQQAVESVKEEAGRVVSRSWQSSRWASILSANAAYALTWLDDSWNVLLKQFLDEV